MRYKTFKKRADRFGRRPAGSTKTFQFQKRKVRIRSLGNGWFHVHRNEK